MRKVVFAVAGNSLTSAGLLTACSSSNTSKASSGEDKKLWLCTSRSNIQFLLKLLHMISHKRRERFDENDKYENLVPSLAERLVCFKDG